MIAAAVQDVNVVRDAWDWVTLAAGLVGALGASVAIGFAVVAQRDATRSRREATAERRRQFELEILREIANEVEVGRLQYHVANGDPSVLRRFDIRLALLAHDELPFWRQLAKGKWHQDVLAASDYGSRIEQANVEHSNVANAKANWADEAAWKAESGRLAKAVQNLNEEFRLSVADRLIAELSEAIRVRVEAGVQPTSGRARAGRWWRFRA